MVQTDSFVAPHPSRVGVTGTVKTGLGTGTRREQRPQEGKKNPTMLRCIAGIKPDDIPVETWSRLIVNTHTHIMQTGEQ